MVIIGVRICIDLGYRCKVATRYGSGLAEEPPINTVKLSRRTRHVEVASHKAGVQTRQDILELLDETIRVQSPSGELEQREPPLSQETIRTKVADENRKQDVLPS